MARVLLFQFPVSPVPGPSCPSIQRHKPGTLNWPMILNLTSEPIAIHVDSLKVSLRHFLFLVFQGRPNFLIKVFFLSFFFFFTFWFNECFFLQTWSLQLEVKDTGKVFFSLSCQPYLYSVASKCLVPIWMWPSDTDTLIICTQSINIYQIGRWCGNKRQLGFKDLDLGLRTPPSLLWTFGQII